MKTVIVWAIAIIAALAALVGIIYVVDRGTCNGRTQDIGFEHRYMFPFGGCQICVNGSWIPLDNYRFLGD